MSRNDVSNDYRQSIGNVYLPFIIQPHHWYKMNMTSYFVDIFYQAGSVWEVDAGVKLRFAAECRS